MTKLPWSSFRAGAPNPLPKHRMNQSNRWDGVIAMNRSSRSLLLSSFRVKVIRLSIASAKVPPEDHFRSGRLVSLAINERKKPWPTKR